MVFEVSRSGTVVSLLSIVWISLFCAGTEFVSASKEEKLGLKTLDLTARWWYRILAISCGWRIPELRRSIRLSSSTFMRHFVQL
jgi:hypothetical protein